LMRVIAFKMDESVLYELDRLARKYKTTRSEIIRRAIIRYLHEERQKNGGPWITSRMRVWT